MPNFEYICDACEHSFEITQGYHDKSKRKCPSCKKLKLRRVLFPAYASVRNDPKTLHHLADRNTQKMGKYEFEEKTKDITEKKKKKKENAPWWRPGTTSVNKKLQKLTPAQEDMYIKTGKL